MFTFFEYPLSYFILLVHKLHMQLGDFLTYVHVK